VTVRACYFIVDDDGTFWRLKKQTFYRILQQREDEVHPEFRGRRIRYAEIRVDYDGRRPVAVQGATFRNLTFDASGRLDESEVQSYEQLFIQKMPNVEELDKPHLTDARAARIDDEIERQFGWQPTRSLRDQLYAAALRGTLVGGTIH
jgi:hypothetical protein